MPGVKGITEPYWSALHEDKKFYWKVFTRALAFVAGYAVAKTGYLYLDVVVGVLTASFSLLIIESQRTYKKYSPKLRKAMVRVSIFLGSWSVAIVGIALFAQIGIVAAAMTVADMVLPQIRSSTSVAVDVVLIVATVIGCFAGIFRAFRGTGFEQMIYDLPKSQLKHLLMKRPLVVKHFLLFAFFELSVLLITLVYTSVAAQTVKSLIGLMGSVQ